MLPNLCQPHTVQARDACRGTQAGYAASLCGGAESLPTSEDPPPTAKQSSGGPPGPQGLFSLKHICTMNS